MTAPTIDVTLADIADKLRLLKRGFALVGGLAVSLRAEVRFTRDVDVAEGSKLENQALEVSVVFHGDSDVVITTVEHTPTKRLATARLESPSGLVVDLIASTSGIEHEIVSRSTLIRLDGIGLLPVARAEELLAMKVLSMTERRLQDRIDARNLVLCSADLDREAVRDDVALIEACGFARGQDLQAKLAGVLEDAGRDD